MEMNRATGTDGRVFSNRNDHNGHEGPAGQEHEM